MHRPELCRPRPRVGQPSSHGARGFSQTPKRDPQPQASILHPGMDPRSAPRGGVGRQNRSLGQDHFGSARAAVLFGSELGFGLDRAGRSNAIEGQGASLGACQSV